MGEQTNCLGSAMMIKRKFERCIPYALSSNNTRLWFCLQHCKTDAADDDDDDERLTTHPRKVRALRAALPCLQSYWGWAFSMGV